MKHGAELVFVERTFSGRGLPGWNGRLLNPTAVDRVTGKPARNYIAKIDYAMPYGSLDGYGEPSPGYERRYVVTMQGNSKHGRSYRRFATIAEAQDVLVKWARRRFYVEA